MPTKIDFIGGNTKRCLMAMALPMIAAMFLNMMYNLVDSLWIGNLLGETAYAALTNSTPIILILTSVAMGATNGVSILISQAIGAKDKKKTESLIATSFSVAVAFSLLVTILLEAFLPGILKALNTPAETYDMAYSYLAIYILGYLAVYLYIYFTAVLRSFGNSMFQAVAMLVSTILNAILDPIFIHFIGFHVQRMGRAEIRIVRAVDVRALQKQVDALCAEQRRLDNEIQQANWMTEIDL